MAYTNCLLAGASGGISSLIVKKGFDLKYHERVKRGFKSVTNSLNYDINT